LKRRLNGCLDERLKAVGGLDLEMSRPAKSGRAFEMPGGSQRGARERERRPAPSGGRRAGGERPGPGARARAGAARRGGKA
jgi:hypothetical protein